MIGNPIRFRQILPTVIQLANRFRSMTNQVLLRVEVYRRTNRLLLLSAIQIHVSRETFQYDCNPFRASPIIIASLCRLSTHIIIHKVIHCIATYKRIECVLIRGNRESRLEARQQHCVAWNQADNVLKWHKLLLVLLSRVVRHQETILQYKIQFVPSTNSLKIMTMVNQPRSNDIEWSINSIIKFRELDAIR